jgi:hypothetical protein
MPLTPTEIQDGTYDLRNVSKDVAGRVVMVATTPKQCSALNTDSLTTIQRLTAGITASQQGCDEDPTRLLDGRLETRNLTTVHNGTTQRDRGIHAAGIVWRLNGGGILRGSMTGTTNAGTDRPLPFNPGFESCLRDGLLIGFLEATGNNIPDSPLPAFTVQATYRMYWDRVSGQSDAQMIGTIEGVLIRPCP